VVLRHALDLVDALDVEFRRPALLPDRLGAFFRDHAEIGQRVAGMRLDLEPDAEAGLRLPDIGHRSAGVTRNHLREAFADWGGSEPADRAALDRNHSTAESVIDSTVLERALGEKRVPFSREPRSSTAPKPLSTHGEARARSIQMSAMLLK